MKITWLSKRSSRWNTSLLIWIFQEAALDYLLQQQMVRFGPTIAQPAPYEPRTGPEQCFKCNRYGNRQFRCKGNPTWDQLRGGNHVRETAYQGEEEPIITLMQHYYDLQLLLPWGTPTYERHDGVGTSTIDLIVTT